MNAIFDPYAALEKLQAQQHAKSENQRVPPATSATFATPAPETPQKSQMSQKSQGPAPKTEFLKEVLSPPLQVREQKIKSLSENPFAYGKTPGGRPVTWTGKVVSLDDWRRLSEWEKHGPAGRVWSQNSHNWESGND